jgi:hypothetical protein
VIVFAYCYYPGNFHYFQLYEAISLFGLRKMAVALSIGLVIGMIMLSDSLWESEFIYKNIKTALLKKKQCSS